MKQIKQAVVESPGPEVVPFRIGWCHDRLAVAGNISTATANDVTALREAGITHVINCRTDPQYAKNLASVLEGHGLGGTRDWRYTGVLWNPAKDDGEPKSIAWFRTSLVYALTALWLPGGKILVHCYHGNNRGPSTALAILMAQGLCYDLALSRVLEARPGAEVRYRRDAAEAVRQLGYV